MSLVATLASQSSQQDVNPGASSSPSSTSSSSPLDAAAAVFLGRRRRRPSPSPSPRRVLLAAAVPPPPPEPNDAFSVTVRTLDELRTQMLQPKILTLYLTSDVLLDNRELPVLEKQLRVLGACGADGLQPCVIDANDASRHFTVGATGVLELHNLVITKGKATGRPWADGGAMFVYGEEVKSKKNVELTCNELQLKYTCIFWKEHALTQAQLCFVPQV